MSTDYLHFFSKLLVHIFCQFSTRILSNFYRFIDVTIDGPLRSFKFVCGLNMSNLTSFGFGVLRLMKESFPTQDYKTFLLYFQVLL